MSLSFVIALPVSIKFSAAISLVFGKCGVTPHCLYRGSLTLTKACIGQAYTNKDTFTTQKTSNYIAFFISPYDYDVRVNRKENANYVKVYEPRYIAYLAISGSKQETTK